LIKKIIGLLGVLLMVQGSAKSQEKVQITRISTPITLDGMPTEEAWQAIPALPVVQYEPVFNGEMSETSLMRVAYDENYLYVSGEMYTRDPSTITTNSLSRDKYSQGDVFGVVIDGFNDNQNATWFYTNPDGVRFDMAVSNDADFGGGRSAINGSWNTFWDVETVRNEKGWFAEMRIPFSSIGVQVQDDVTEMGIIIYRWISSANERHIYPSIPPNWGLGNAKPSQAQDVVLKGIKSKKPLYFTPYVLGGVNTMSNLKSDSSAYYFNDDVKKEVGFDLKYNLTSNLTMDVTVNTDFAQVEADDQQLNLSRFSLSFPEKRQFFQQRSSIFDFNFGRDRLFYSRRIGLDSSGNPVRILGGARLTGRVGDLDIGMINMQTADSDNLPSENFGVLRIRKSVLNQRSYMGGIFTSRIGADGSSNIVYGFDGDVNTVGDHFVEFKMAQSIDDGIPKEDRYDFKETSAVRFGVRSTSSTGFGYQFTFNRMADDLRPSLGFVRVGGTSQKFARLSYGWVSGKNSVFRRTGVRVFYYGRFYNSEHEMLSFTKGIQGRTLSTQWEGKFKYYGDLSIEFNTGKENIPAGNDFNLIGKIYIPSGTYTDEKIQLRYQFSESWTVGGNINANTGTIYDGNISELELSPRFFVSKQLELGGSYRITHLSFPERQGRDQTEFTSHLAQFKGQFAFNKKATLSTFLQYSNVAELVGANIRFRYNFSEGQDLWIVVNEQNYTDRVQNDPRLPNLPYLQARSILLKYNHTFSF
jgi:hypothetical protein